MEHQLSDIVPLLLQQNRSSKSVSFGHIAVQLLACVQAIQERKHVVVDIKPENFMLTYGTGKGSTASQKLASRIRILDLALVQPWASIGAHRSNDGIKGLAGTPLYASLNLHKGETPSRRDDFESLGYVIAELLMQLASGDTSKQLPWSYGQSDEEIGRLKEEYVSNPKSDFYKQLGGSAVAKVFSEYMDEVREYSYKKKPDYEALSKILENLKVPIPTKKPAATRATANKQRKTASSRRQASRVTTGTKRATRSRANEPSSEEETPSKMQRGNSYTCMEVEYIPDSDEDEFVDTQQGCGVSNARDDDDTFYSAHAQEPETMDWEMSPDENQQPVLDSKPKALVGVTVVIETGPHKGQAFNLIKGNSESIIVGRNPESKRGETALLLPNDQKIDNSHIRMDLSVSKKLISVNVTDLKSSSGSFVGADKIRTGKDYRIFRGGTVRIGETLLAIKSLDPSNSAVSNQDSKPSEQKRANMQKEASKIFHVPRLKRRGVRLEVTEGPHKGETFELEQHGIETFNVGSTPSSKSGNALCLKRDSSLKATHVRLDLVVSKKLTTVTVTDKSKGGTAVNRDVVSKGRAFINDTIKIGNSVLEIKSL